MKHEKAFIELFLSVVMVVMLLPVTAEAASVDDSSVFCAKSILILAHWLQRL